MSIQARPTTEILTESTRTLTIDEALEFAEQQVRRLVTTSPERITTYTEGGKWIFNEDPWAPTWTGGFLAGMMWIFACRTGSQWWQQQAQRYSRLLEPRKNDTGTHDLGFLLEPSWGRWYDLTKYAHARDVLVQGGRTMAKRLRPGGYLCTWVDAGSTFIDVMMNVGIVFRAAAYSDDRRLQDIALKHCKTSRRYLVRGDGSTAHEARFDPQTGQFLYTSTHQGWRPDSTWARGQAWAIYGFTTAYRHTADTDMLDTACRTAHHYIRHAPEHGVPPNDFDEPAPPQRWEASAAAIAAAGMLHLADALAEDPSAADRYRNYGLKTLRTLCSTEFIASDTEGWQGILRHATYHHSNGLGINESVMWGDHYLVEALALAARSDRSTPEGYHNLDTPH